MMETGDADHGDQVGFNSWTVSMRMQKKVLGKMASRGVAKHFVSETTAHLLDSFYRILKDFYGKKDAEKVIKNILKMVLKVGVLWRNECFNANEQKLVEQFQHKFRNLMMTVVSFEQVDFSYDRAFLQDLIADCERFLLDLIRPHLSDMSSQRVRMIFQYTSKGELLDAVFRPQSSTQSGRYREALHSICVDLTSLMDRKEL